ncbi:hypothetical protein [Haloarcula saliterrae]|nr:hypothetical protein [Haloarcula sp. S1CR25-12]
MLDVGPLTLALLAVVLGFFFFLYLMVRRTILGFKEGMQGGREK